jgi:hypothetical protein
VSLDAIPEENWQTTATLAVLEAAFLAETAIDPEEGRKDIYRSLIDFADAAIEHGDDDRDWFALVLGLAHAAVGFAAPDAFGPGDGPTGVVMQSQLTGRPIDDPDAEADTASMAAGLAAMRIIAAVNDGDTDRAADVFKALGVTEAGTFMLVLLAEYAAGMIIGKGEREGTLHPDAVARLKLRCAMLPPAPEPPKTHVSKTGTTYVDLPLSDEDKGPEARDRAAPHGPAQYGCAIYVPGVEGHRDKVVATLHREIAGGGLSHPDLPDRTLCGVQHWEDIETWQLPTVGKRETSREVRRLQRHLGRPVQVVRCWQHLGDCGGDA